MQVQQRKGTAMSKAAMSKTTSRRESKDRQLQDNRRTDDRRATGCRYGSPGQGAFAGVEISGVDRQRHAPGLDETCEADGKRQAKATIDLRTNLSRDVTAFLDIAAQTVPTFARAHQKMAKQQRSSLEAGRQELGAEVSKFRSAIQHDLMGAHQIWSALAHG
jgi:hypothetical protein